MNRDLEIAADMLADDYRLDPRVIMAVVRVESAGNPLAVRYEPDYRYLVSPDVWAKRLGLSTATETAMQRMSFGVMQVMGAVAREYGFDGNLLSLVKDPLQALRYGVHHLASMYDRFGPKSAQGLRDFDEAAVAAYNAGSPRRGGNGRWVNEGYVKKVRLALSPHA